MEGELEGSQNARVEALWKSLNAKDEQELDAKGLKEGLKRIDHPLKDADDLLERVIKLVDKTGDGRIQFQEFLDFIVHAENQLWALFKTIDQDEDNRISKEELHHAFENSGLNVPPQKIEDFFIRVDTNHDGMITFGEWRDFLLFIPAQAPGLRSVLTYFSSSVKVNSEGDVQVGDETIQSLGTIRQFISSLFGVFKLVQTPSIRHRPPDLYHPPPTQQIPLKTVENTTTSSDVIQLSTEMDGDILESPYSEDALDSVSAAQQKAWSILTDIGFNPGYFLAGGISGIVSRTSTAPLDRLKVYLIAQTSTASQAIEAAKSGSPLAATKHAVRPIQDALAALWKAGGLRSLFAGNGLNVAKVMPESAIKFGTYEAAKRAIAQIEGHGDPKAISSWSQFIAGGVGGIVSQACVYPVDTLKFRMQCETVEGGLHGNALIKNTAIKMWTAGGLRAYYRGLSMGLVGMFPYSAIDLGTFEFLKKTITQRNARERGCSMEEAVPGSVATAAIGGFSGALGASLVYPLNVLRTRLQTQGTASHQRTYTGIVDVTMQTIRGEGVRGLFRGLTPNLLKVVPAVSITYVVYENSKKMLKLH